jgi:threonine/homoserine/homoserine lactone efflux protein
MTFTNWLAFAAASSVMLLIPGPTVLLVVSYGLTQGRRVAVAVAAGVAAGDLFAITLSLAGLGAIVAASATLFTALKWAGAAYLLYLAVRLWRASPVLAAREPPPPGGGWKIFLHAFAVTALNPKSIAFFVAFVPLFIDPAAALLPQLVVLEGTFVGLALVNAFAYALAADRVGRTIRRPAVLRWLNRGGAGALAGMAAATVASRG